MVTVSEQYKLEQKNKQLKEEKSKLLRYFVCEKVDEVIEMAGDWSHNNGILREKLEQIKELAKVFQREEWGDCRYIRKIICGKLNEILTSQEKD